LYFLFDLGVLAVDPFYFHEENMMNVWDAIYNKRAIRAFRDAPLPDDVVERILEAGRVAQSSRNEQPWDFIAVRDRERLRQLAASGYYPFVAQSGLTVVITTPPMDVDKPLNFAMYLFDVGQAAANMQLAAQELGVGSGLGRVFKGDVARELLAYPADKEATMLIAFGYPESDDMLTRKGEPNRRPFDDVVHYETW